MAQKYFGNWKSRVDVICDFIGYRYEGSQQIPDDAPKGFPTDREILIAAYETDNDGTAIVVYRQKGKLYEVNGSHCSCFGLREPDGNGWKPEETTKKALAIRQLSSMFGADVTGRWAELFLAPTLNVRTKKLAKLPMRAALRRIALGGINISEARRIAERAL